MANATSRAMTANGRNTTPVGSQEGEINISADLESALRTVLLNGMGGGPQIDPDEGIAFHDDPRILVPAGWSYKQVRDAIARAEKEAETVTTWRRVFDYRPNDGAYALMQVLRATYGGAVGESTMTFFGPQPPELATIKISYTDTAQVPFGQLSLPALPDLEINSAATHSNEHGRRYMIFCEGPRKYKDQVEKLFDDVEAHLARRSIYRGQQVIGTEDMDFVDLSSFRAAEIVFSDKAQRLLEATLWAPLRNWRDLEAEGVPLKRAVILHGPYGTGKTSAGLITAQVAHEAGWTYIAARAGRESVIDALRVAKLYQPAVVFVEDFNEGVDGDDSDAMAELLEAFDGATSKGSKVMVVVTTNHIERIPRGMLRPGRFDSMVEIAHLDRAGIERLIKAVVGPDKRRADIDYDVVCAAMGGFYPAFVREAVDRARIVAIGAHGRNYLLDTDSLVTAAMSLAEQLRYLEDAGEGARRPTLDTVFRTNVREALIGLKGQGGRDDFYMVEPGSKDDDSTHD